VKTRARLRECGAIRHVELVEERRHVLLDGLLGDSQRRCDLLVALAEKDVRQYFELTWCEMEACGGASVFARTAVSVQISSVSSDWRTCSQTGRCPYES